MIDSDYRGLLGILLFNFGSEDFNIKPGDRIAQLILERIETPEVEVVKVSKDILEQILFYANNVPTLLMLDVLTGP